MGYYQEAEHKYNESFYQFFILSDVVIQGETKTIQTC